LTEVGTNRISGIVDPKHVQWITRLVLSYRESLDRLQMIN